MFREVVAGRRRASQTTGSAAGTETLAKVGAPVPPREPAFLMTMDYLVHRSDIAIA